MSYVIRSHMMWRGTILRIMHGRKERYSEEVVRARATWNKNKPFAISLESIGPMCVFRPRNAREHGEQARGLLDAFCLSFVSEEIHAL